MKSDSRELRTPVRLPLFMQTVDRRLVLILSLSLITMAQTGCSSRVDQPPVPVAGSVLVNGKPAAYAKLTFHPAREQQAPPLFAKADENGEFTLFVPVLEDDEGTVEYHVGISWRIPQNPRDRNDPDYGDELLPKKFQDPKQSGLKVEIDPAIEELDPFELKT